MTSRVCFFDFSKLGDVLEGIDELLGRVSDGTIDGKQSVAVKIHFGERGNYTHIRPSFVRRVVDFVKEVRGSPFVTDTTALYPEGARFTVEESLDTARYNGFTEYGLGCPIVIADEPDGYNGVEANVRNNVWGGRLECLKVARRIADAESAVIISHVKGHILSGMGGAIKNLAMGCTTKEGKRSQHAMHGLIFNHDLCSGCGDCCSVCRFHAIVMRENKPVHDGKKCMYCLTCKYNCDKKAIGIYEDGKERFQEGMAEAAAGVMKVLKGKPVLFLNFIIDVTPLCDCASPAGMLVVQNIGILASRDPVAIDRASLDLIDGAQAISGWGASPPDVLGKINGTRSLIHMEAAERLGLGKMSYRLETISK